MPKPDLSQLRRETAAIAEPEGIQGATEHAQAMLTQRPGVVGVGDGEHGELVVYVTDVRAATDIPDRIEGRLTRVKVTGPLSTLSM